MLSLLVAAVLCSSFPLPSVDGKAPAVAEGQTTFRIPMRFEKAKAFYVAQLGGQQRVTLREKSDGNRRVIVLTTTQEGATWAKAIVREGEVDTTIEVTPVIRLADEQIEGQAKPLVQFLFGRSPEVEKALNTIDHTESLRH